MFLAEEHLDKAKEIVLKYRKKKSCKKCFDRGYVGVSQENTLVVCEKCVDIDAAMNEWKDYVATDEELKEEFKELFEENTEGSEENTDSEKASE